MNFEKEPTLKEFNDNFVEYVNECMSPNGNIQSHTYPASISIWSDEDECCYELVSMNHDYKAECGCSVGVELIIKKVSS